MGVGVAPGVGVGLGVGLGEGVGVGLSVSVSVAELLSGFVSDTSGGAVTVAVLDKFPVARAEMLAVTV